MSRCTNHRQAKHVAGTVVADQSADHDLNAFDSDSVRQTPGMGFVELWLFALHLSSLELLAWLLSQMRTVIPYCLEDSASYTIGDDVFLVALTKGPRLRLPPRTG